MSRAGDLIDRFGGTSIVAKALGVSIPAVSQWRRRGIPADRREGLLALAEADLAVARAEVAAEKKPKGRPKGFKVTEAARLRMSEAMNRPEVKAKQSVAIKAALANPEVKARKAAIIKALWADPEYRARRSQFRRGNSVSRERGSLAGQQGMTIVLTTTAAVTHAYARRWAIEAGLPAGASVDAINAARAALRLNPIRIEEQP
jgi:DNA-binding transcriptional regulator YdaS (Cro superfamily)